MPITECEAVLGGDLITILDKNILITMLSKIYLLRQLPYKKLIDIVHYLDEISIGPGGTIFSEGDIGDIFYIVKLGTVGIYINH